MEEIVNCVDLTPMFFWKQVKKRWITIIMNMDVNVERERKIQMIVIVCVKLLQTVED